MRYVEKDSTRKDYNYVSRYANLDTYFNSKDKTRYYETARPINKSKVKNYVTHIVGRNETLDTIALKYYGRPLYWWIIADYNDILDVFNLKEGTNLKIPYLSDIEI